MTSEARIRQLCSQAIASEDPEELAEIAIQLQIAIHVHCEKLKIKLADYYSDLTEASRTRKVA
jgi:hypothetical protein